MGYTENMFNNERFNFKILSVLKLEFPVSERYSPPRRYHALVFRMQGRAEVAKEGRSARLIKNDITFVPRGYDYTIRTESDEKVTVVHFEADFQTPPPFSNIHTSSPEIFNSLFEKLLNTWQIKPCGHVYRIDSLFLSILENIEKQVFEMKEDSVSLRIQRAADSMHSRFTNHELSVDILARESGYCSSYFRRIFREEMGKSPKEYLCELRIRHATALLESGYYSVDAVAALSGFDSSKYFSTAFKAHTGKSPSEYLPRVSRRKK
ncbi:MAG: helix-turn-helix transcriptional regulator [Clostridia bacterium]|nr:helix-turn-helix transcriptional regulator [Clostridia bacterium]